MRPTRPYLATGAGALALTVMLVSCGGGNGGTSNGANDSGGNGGTQGVAGSSAQAPDPNATEVNPPGDIPDDQVFVRYTPPGAGFSVKVPEGWARSTSGGTVTFTDKLNSIGLATTKAPSAPTVASARNQEVPAIKATAPQYAPGDVTAVSRQAGRAVLITYLQDSEPDPVTHKVVRDAVERYEFWRGGHEAILTLSGPKGADNVDPWRIVSDSLRWS